MSVKSQLHACSELLVVGVRAAARAGTPDDQAVTILRACQEVIERLERYANELAASHVDLALAVVSQAKTEFGNAPGTKPVVLGAVRNAVDRLQRLKAELPA